MAHHQGNYGGVKLDGLGAAFAVRWPRAIHEGNGTASLFFDERADAQQRGALLQICSGQAGGLPLAQIMERPLRLESVLKRDRLLVAAGLAGITLLAWGYMVHEAQAMYNTGVCSCAGMKMSGPHTDPWSTATLLPLFLMWAEMMVAMMNPSAPMILSFALVQRKRREQERPFVPTGFFLLGYLVVWTVFSALAAVAQWILHARALLSPMMVSTSPLLGGALLIAAGVFQWTPLKNACLTHCRSPLGFLMTDWREGKLGALAMGLKYGAFCSGCCWFLMALLFVAGVMNMWWIGIIAVFVLAEKIAPRGWFVGKIAGALLAAWGVWMMWR